MGFISIKKYLKQGGRPVAQDYLRVIELLLEGMALHAVEGDSEDLFRFRDDVRSVAATIADDGSGAELLVSAGRVLSALDEYSRQTQRFMHAQALELQRMLSLFTQTVASLTASSQEGVGQLQKLEKKIEKASVIEDIRSLRGQLEDCLGTLREETLRQREESSRTISALDASVSKVKARLEAVRKSPVKSPETGLSTRHEAEKAISRSAEMDGQHFAAFFVMDNLHSVLSRFGEKVQAEVLMTFANHLAQAFGGRENLYHWSMESFVAVVEKNVPLARFQTEVRQIAGVRLEKILTINSRQVMLPLTCRWFVLAISNNEPQEALFKKMDTFLAGQKGVAIRS